jgi:hypothetical protein
MTGSVGPELAIAIASQIPTLEAAGFVRLALLSIRPPRSAGVLAQGCVPSADGARRAGT